MMESKLMLFVFGRFVSPIGNPEMDEAGPDFMSLKFDLTFFNKSGITLVVTMFKRPEIRKKLSKLWLNFRIKNPSNSSKFNFILNVKLILVI